MKVRRWDLLENGCLYPNDENGYLCYYKDVAKLEALHAELLAAAKDFVESWGDETITIVDRLRAAKALIAELDKEQNHE